MGHDIFTGWSAPFNEAVANWLRRGAANRTRSLRSRSGFPMEDGHDSRRDIERFIDLTGAHVADFQTRRARIAVRAMKQGKDYSVTSRA